MLKFLAIFLISIGAQAHAGVFDVGGTLSYSKSTYNGGSYTWTRGWTGTFGYFFTQESELEVMYLDSVTKDYLAGSQDITYHDRTYSINMLYHLFTEADPVRPYFKVGIGQLNRNATGTYAANGAVFAPPSELDQITVILGAGVKVKLASQFSLKGEATSYLSGGNIGSWKDNISVNIGGSYYF